jgi:hypothetical protein
MAFFRCWCTFKKETKKKEKNFAEPSNAENNVTEEEGEALQYF